MCAADGQDVQDALNDVTSRRTVPQVFVSGKFIGGCDGELAACLHCAIPPLPKPCSSVASGVEQRCLTNTQAEAELVSCHH